MYKDEGRRSGSLATGWIRRLMMVLATLVFPSLAAAQDFTEDLLETLRRSGSIDAKQHAELLAKYHASRARETRPGGEGRLEAELASLRHALAGASEKEEARLESKVGRGFTFTSADERFKLNISGLIQVQYEFADLDADHRDLDPRPARDAAQDVSNFRMSRVRVQFGGHLYDPKLTYKLQFDTTAESDLGLRDGFLNYELTPELQLMAGQFKMPFGRQRQYSNDRLSLIGRALPTGVFTADRELGAMAWGLVGEEGELEWLLAVSNGEGRGKSNPDTAHRLEGVLRFQPFGGPGGKAHPTRSLWEMDYQCLEDPFLSLGGGFSYNPRSNADETTTRYGFEGQLLWQGFSLQGEWFRQCYDPDPGDRAWSKGWYAQASYFVVPSVLNIALRYDRLDLDADTLIAAGGGFDDRTSVSLGATWYLSSDRPDGLKILADWTHLNSEHTARSHGLRDEVFRIMLSCRL